MVTGDATDPALHGPLITYDFAGEAFSNPSGPELMTRLLR